MFVFGYLFCLKQLCEGCKHFSIEHDGNVERYKCLNDERWEDLGYEDEEDKE